MQFRFPLRTLSVSALALFPVQTAWAGSVIDYLRDYDLNNYALGVAYSASQKPYLDGGSSGFAYPYLTSFQNIAFTDDWLIVDNGDLGARWVGDSGLILGGVGRIKTHGTGETDVGEALGIDTRRWTVEVAPLIGWRRWPVHFGLKYYTEVFNQHGGNTTELEATFPMEFNWGYLVPRATLIRNDATHNQYYYGVSESELLPDRETYSPGASTNPKLGLSWGVSIHNKWLLTGSVSHEWLDTPITDSPIVGKDTLWAANVGVAYNTDLFQSRDFTADAIRLPTFEIRGGLFRDNIDSKVVRKPVDNEPGEEIDLEDVLGAADQVDVWQIDAIVRFNPYHRMELGYFQLNRESGVVLLQDLTIGDQTFPEGTQLAIRADARVTRVAYAFSLMNDAQKELGVMAGVHVTRFETDIVSTATGQSETSKLSTPLPVIGVHGSIALGLRTDLQARVHVFRMAFDHYEGSLSYLYFGLAHAFSENIGAGIGYNYYAMNLNSSDESLRGSFQAVHQGPLVYFGLSF